MVFFFFLDCWLDRWVSAGLSLASMPGSPFTQLSTLACGGDVLLAAVVIREGFTKQAKGLLTASRRRVPVVKAMLKPLHDTARGN